MSEGIQKFNIFCFDFTDYFAQTLTTSDRSFPLISDVENSIIANFSIFEFSFPSCSNEKGCFGNVRNFSIIYSTMIHTFIFRRCYMMLFLPIFLMFYVLCSSGCSFRQSFIGRTWNVKRNRNFSHCECQYFLPKRKYGFSVLLKVRSSSYLSTYISCSFVLVLLENCRTFFRFITFFNFSLEYRFLHFNKVSSLKVSHQQKLSTRVTYTVSKSLCDDGWVWGGNSSWVYFFLILRWFSPRLHAKSSETFSVSSCSLSHCLYTHPQHSGCGHEALESLSTCLLVNYIARKKWEKLRKLRNWRCCYLDWTFSLSLFFFRTVNTPSSSLFDDDSSETWSFSFFALTPRRDTEMMKKMITPREFLLFEFIHFSQVINFSSCRLNLLTNSSHGRNTNTRQIFLSTCAEALE